LEPLATYQGAPTHNAPIRLSYHYACHYNSIIDPEVHKKQLLTTKPGEIEDIQIQESKKRGGRRAENFVVTDHIRKHMSDMDEAIYRSLNPETLYNSVMDSAARSLADLKKQMEATTSYYMSPDNSSHPNYNPSPAKPSNHGNRDKKGVEGSTEGAPFDKMDDMDKAIHLSLEEQKKAKTGNLVDWTCSACTYLNSKTVQDRCAVCQTAKSPKPTTTTTSNPTSNTTVPTNNSTEPNTTGASSASSNSSSETTTSSSSSESTSSPLTTSSSADSSSSLSPSTSSSTSSTTSTNPTDETQTSNTSPSSPSTTPKKSESTPSSSNIKPETKQQLPGPIRHCHEMLGFSLHKCEVAYNIALADLAQTTEPSDEVVIQNMTTLLLQS